MSKNEHNGDNSQDYRIDSEVFSQTAAYAAKLKPTSERTKRNGFYVKLYLRSMLR